MSVCGVVPVAAIVPLCPTGMYRHYRGTTTVHACSSPFTAAKKSHTVFNYSRDPPVTRCCARAIDRLVEGSRLIHSRL